jgi:transcriptional antiterminator NusG
MIKENWYAVHVLSQYENKVKSHIDKIKKERGYEDKIKEVIIPVDTETKRIQGKKVEKKTKVFPGYVLVKMKLDEDTFNFIKRIPGVTNFVSSSAKKPVALKESEVKSILDALNPDKGFLPKKKFSKDMLVRIVEGPFAEFTGKIETVYEDKETLRVMISLFGRDTPIEIEFAQVEKAE